MYNVDVLYMYVEQLTDGSSLTCFSLASSKRNPMVVLNLALPEAKKWYSMKRRCLSLTLYDMYFVWVWQRLSMQERMKKRMQKLVKKQCK